MPAVTQGGHGTGRGTHGRATFMRPDDRLPSRLVSIPERQSQAVPNSVTSKVTSPRRRCHPPPPPRRRWGAPHQGCSGYSAERPCDGKHYAFSHMCVDMSLPMEGSSMRPTLALALMTGVIALGPTAVTADWVNRTPVTSPPGRAGLTMAYDAARRRVVLFGGELRTPFGRRARGAGWISPSESWDRAGGRTHQGGARS